MACLSPSSPEIRDLLTDARKMQTDKMNAVFVICVLLMRISGEVDAWITLRFYGKFVRNKICVLVGHAWRGS